MKRHTPQGRGQPAGPSQRQLRAGELVRHALVEILREEDIADPDLAGVSVTVSEVRMSPDLKHATCFVEPLGGEQAPQVIKALNRHAKFTPDLKFRHDESFDNAAAIDRLFDDPRVRADLARFPGPDGTDDGA